MKALLLLAALAASVAAGPVTLRQLYGMQAPAGLASAHTALLLVDFQREFTEGALPVPDAGRAAGRAEALASWARSRGMRVVHVRQLGRPGGLFAAEAGGRDLAAVGQGPGDWTVEKKSGGGFTHTDLDARLHAAGIDSVIVAGIMTHLAVDLTAQDASLLGYRVLVASDASATRDLPGAAGAPVVPAATVHAATLAALADRFAEVRTSAEIMALPER